MKAFQTPADTSYRPAQHQQDWAEKTYADNKGVSDQVIDKALGALDKQAAWADPDRERYEDIYQPLEDQAAQGRRTTSRRSARKSRKPARPKPTSPHQFAQARQNGAGPAGRLRR